MSARIAAPSLVAIQIAACMGFLVVQLDVSVVNVALGALKDALGTDLTGLEWVINSYALTFSALLIPGGALGDRFGARTVFAFGFLVFTIASVGCGLSASTEMLIALRCLQGAGAALLLPNSLTIIRISFSDPVARASAVATWGACGGLALAAGPVLGGLMIQHLGWPSVFFLNIPVGMLAIGLVMRFAPPSPQGEKKADVQGQVAAAICLAALTYSLTESSREGWGAGPLAALLVAVLSGLWFQHAEKHSPFPMLPERLRRNRILATTALCGAVINMTFYGTVFALSIYYQTVLHYSSLKTGIAFIPLTAVLTVSTMASSRIARRVAATHIITFGFMLQCVAFLALSRLTTMAPDWRLHGALMMVGVGSAVSVPSITNSMLASVSKHDAGMASGLMASARQMGGVVGVAVFGALIASQDTGGFARGMSHAMLFAAFGLVASVIVVIKVRPGAASAEDV